MKQGLPVLLCILDILFQADFMINLSIQIEEQKLRFYKLYFMECLRWKVCVINIYF